MYVDEQTYLEHYGIKGMHWGIRRYDDDDRVRRAKRQYDKTVSSSTATKQSKRIAKKEVADARTLARIDDKGLSDREKKLEAEYKSQGLSDREAKLSAAQRVKTEKILAVVGGLGVGTAAVYLAKRGYAKRVDTLIKAGTKIQNINTHDPKGVKDAFYGAFKKGDMKTYRTAYAKQLKSNIFTGDKVYNTTIEATKDIKVASENTVKKALQDLVKNDPRFKYELQNNIELNTPGLTPRQILLKKKAAYDIGKGKVTNAVVRAQNTTFVERDNTSNKALFNELKKRGYGAVRDVNDSQLSGYNTKAPTVFFDTAKTAVKGSSEITERELATKGTAGLVKLTAKQYARQGVGIGGAVATKSAISNQRQRTKDNQAVMSYKKEHPNTNMSDYDILRMLEKQKKERKR